MLTCTYLFPHCLRRKKHKAPLLAISTANEKACFHFPRRHFWIADASRPNTATWSTIYPPFSLPLLQNRRLSRLLHNNGPGSILFAATYEQWATDSVTRGLEGIGGKLQAWEGRWTKNTGRSHWWRLRWSTVAVQVAYGHCSNGSLIPISMAAGKGKLTIGQIPQCAVYKTVKTSDHQV